MCGCSLAKTCTCPSTAITSLAGSGDIVDKNLKLILGLIWTLILHYQISIGFGIDNDKDQDGPTPKQALMAYLQVCLPTFDNARTIGP